MTRTCEEAARRSRGRVTLALTHAGRHRRRQPGLPFTPRTAAPDARRWAGSVRAAQKAALAVPTSSASASPRQSLLRHPNFSRDLPGGLRTHLRLNLRPFTARTELREMCGK